MIIPDHSPVTTYDIDRANLNDLNTLAIALRGEPIDGLSTYADVMPLIALQQRGVTGVSILSAIRLAIAVETEQPSFNDAGDPVNIVDPNGRDGHEILGSYLNIEGEEPNFSVDGARLVVNVFGNPGFWSVALHRSPKVVRTLEFRNPDATSSDK